MIWLMLTGGQWPFRKVNFMCDDLDSLTLIFHFFNHFSMMWFSWMLVSRMCIVHREEDQECSLGAHRNGCGSGLKFLHWILFRIGVHLVTISAGWNSLRVRFFWFWIVALGAILYQTPGLRLKIRLYNTVGFPWLYWWHLLHGGIVALWSEPVESKLMVCDSVLRVHIFIDFFEYKLF
jgi:hypothetical protein